MNLIDLREIPNINNLFYVESIDSTQDELINLIKNGDKHHYPIGIYSFNQTNGRGQRNRDWVNEKNKGIALSIALPLNENTDFINLNKSIALLVNEFVSEMSGQKSWIKWPNDIIIDGNKVVGLLMEIFHDANHNKVLVVGIGMNILTPTSDLKRVSGILNNSHQNFESLFKISTALYNKISRVIVSCSIEEKYNQQLYQRNNTISLMSFDNNIISGKLLSVDSAGRLVFEVDSEILRFHFGQARIIL